MQKIKYVKSLLGLLIIILLGACAEESSKKKASPEIYCREQQLQNQYIAHWYNRQPTLEMLEDVDKFIKEHYNELRFVEPNYVIRIPENVNRINPNSVHSSRTILERIGAVSAWDQGFRGQNIIVAVVDSGVDIFNRHLAQNIYKNQREKSGNALDDDNNGYIDDIYGWNFTKDNPYVVDEIGHGTSIAGIITGTWGSDDSLAIAPRAKILPLDIMSGSTGTEFDAKRAVDYALGMNAKVVNNSWSISCSEYLATAFKEYQKHNVIFVNSAGNVHQNVVVSQLMLASLAFSNFLNVGSTDILGQLSGFSGYGPTINMWAPGEQIPVITSADSWSTMTEASGTSVSAAIVSGAAAVVWSAYPHEKAQQIISRIVRGANRIGGRNFISLKDALPPLPPGPSTYESGGNGIHEEASAENEPEEMDTDDGEVSLPPEPLPQPILESGDHESEEPGGRRGSREPRESSPPLETPISDHPEDSSQRSHDSNESPSQEGTETGRRQNSPNEPASPPPQNRNPDSEFEPDPVDSESSDDSSEEPISDYDANLPETPHAGD